MDPSVSNIEYQTTRSFKEHLLAFKKLIELKRLEANSTANRDAKRGRRQRKQTLHSLTEEFVATAANVRHRAAPLYGNSVLTAGVPAGRENSRFANLTAREKDVFVHLAQGHSNKVIAYKLKISDTTVKAHVTRILGKLGVHSRMRAVALFRVLIPDEAAHHNEMMSPVVTE